MVYSDILIKYDVSWLIHLIESGQNPKYVFFWGHTNRHRQEVGRFCLSQWYESPFTVGNILYKTAEHWMMAQKALLFSDKEIFERIIACDKPGEAKELGRQIKEYNDLVWDQYKRQIVLLGSIHKFNQHPLLGDFLIKTENRVLVEASPVDTIWGIGLSPDDRDLENVYAWRGQNLLGFALMQARDFLQEFGRFYPLDDPLPAPWMNFSGISKDDLFWKDGQGAEYLKNFNEYYRQLGERERKIYQLNNPPPIDWCDLYSVTNNGK